MDKILIPFTKEEYDLAKTLGTTHKSTEKSGHYGSGLNSDCNTIGNIGEIVVGKLLQQPAKIERIEIWSPHDFTINGITIDVKCKEVGSSLEYMLVVYQDDSQRQYTIMSDIFIATHILHYPTIHCNGWVQIDGYATKNMVLNAPLLPSRVNTRVTNRCVPYTTLVSMPESMYEWYSKQPFLQLYRDEVIQRMKDKSTQLQRLYNEFKRDIQ